MSTSRLEKFIYAICSMEVSDLPAPLSRIEILWNCLITGETPDFEPQSRNEQYLMAMLGLYELENLPAPMSRGEKLLYKIAMGETDLSDIPAYLSRYEELLGYLAENGGVGDFEYILQTLNQRLSTLYSTKERPMKQAVIKGDTLVNELPRPSLKNTMTNVASQKLNHGYDNGKTLVNIKGEKTDLVSDTRRCDFLIPLVKTNTVYLIKYNITVTGGSLALGFLNDTSTWSNNLENAPTNGIIKLNSGNNPNYFRCIVNRDQVITVNNLMIIEYQDGMENWDIPYFEGTKTFSATPNVVDGEFKQMIVKGQTLVNIKGEETTEFLFSGRYYNDLLLNGAKDNTRYLILYDLTLTDTVKIGILKRETGSNVTWASSTGDYNTYSKGKLILNTTTNTAALRIISSENNSHVINNLTIIEYQDGMENWDIPYFEGMQSVQLSEVTTNGGNNLVDKSLIVERWVDGSSGIDNSSEGCYIPIHVSGTIAISGYTPYNNNPTYIYQYDKNGTYLGRKPGSSEMLLKLNANTEFIKVGFYKGTIDYINSLNIKVANHSNTLTLAEPVNLRKVGDVEDEFDALTGQVTERVGEMVLDGNESWTVNGDRKTVVSYICHSVVGSLNANNIKCSEFPTRTDGGTNNVEMIRLSSTSGKIIIHILKSKIGMNNDTTVSNGNDATNFKQWLSQNPIRVQYELKTPVIKTVNPTITDQDGATQTKLHSFNDGYLSVSSQGLLPSAVNYEVPTNNSYYLPDMLTLGAQYTSRGSADCNATIDGKLLALGKNRTFTTPSTLTNRLMVLDAPVDDLMFIKGDQTAKDFGYFEGMKSVRLSNKMPVLTTIGKNLWDGKWYKGFSNTGGGGELATLNDLKTAYRTDYIKIPKNSDRVYVHRFCEDTNYTGTNVHFGFFDKNKQLLIVEGGLSPASWSIPTNAEYVVIHVWNSVPYDFTTLRVNVSTTPVNATSYEPYKSNILTVNEDMTLRGIGDGSNRVEDELDCLTGEVTERVGEIVLDGSEDWKLANPVSNNNNNLRLYCTIETAKSGLFTKGVISNRFAIVDTVNYEGIAFTVGNKNLHISINKTKLDEISVNGFKQWLSQNPVTVQYHLETESIKTVDLTTVDQDGQPTKLKTFNDISYVEINSENMIPSVDVEVATKMNETLSTLGLEHHDISNTQNKLGQTIDEQSENTDATMMATTEIYEQTL